MENSHNEPKYIEVRGARVHNLKNVNVNVPLHQRSPFRVSVARLEPEPNC